MIGNGGRERWGGGLERQASGAESFKKKAKGPATERTFSGRNLDMPKKGLSLSKCEKRGWRG